MSRGDETVIGRLQAENTMLTSEVERLKGVIADYLSNADQDTIEHEMWLSLTGVEQNSFNELLADAASGRRLPLTADGVRWDGESMPWVAGDGEKFGDRQAWYVKRNQSGRWVAYNGNYTNFSECYSTLESMHTAETVTDKEPTP